MPRPPGWWEHQTGGSPTGAALGASAGAAGCCAHPAELHSFRPRVSSSTEPAALKPAWLRLRGPAGRSATRGAVLVPGIEPRLLQREALTHARLSPSSTSPTRLWVRPHSQLSACSPQPLLDAPSCPCSAPLSKGHRGPCALASCPFLSSSSPGTNPNWRREAPRQELEAAVPNLEHFASTYKRHRSCLPHQGKSKPCANLSEKKTSGDP